MGRSPLFLSRVSRSLFLYLSLFLFFSLSLFPCHATKVPNRGRVRCCFFARCRCFLRLPFINSNFWERARSGTFLIHSIEICLLFSYPHTKNNTYHHEGKWGGGKRALKNNVISSTVITVVVSVYRTGSNFRSSSICHTGAIMFYYRTFSTYFNV